VIGFTRLRRRDDSRRHYLATSEHTNTLTTAWCRMKGEIWLLPLSDVALASPSLSMRS